MRQNFFIALVFIFASPTLNQHVLTNIPFECKGRLDGFWRDLRYCDVFHACIAGEHKRSYGCPQFGEKFYFDEKAQICDFAFNKTGVCETNDYYTSITTVPALPGRQPGAKNFFIVDPNVSCNGQANGAYLSSQYCNIFHRCVSGSRIDFRCPRANNVPYDLWWNQQTRPCDWPCRVQCNNQLFGSSTSAQQVQRESLIFFNNDCRDYPPIFRTNKK
ncbi:unnamed protein product [Rotaria magnacalcarata]|uniref:Chitin-binding type-2 domain-containing protein n=1 Tax=Rotaria magnacalcarata TaxID=392030 RepID=A0A816R0X1_9BILA|nr:unnamed protein product [Rotaria magnacalcarata]